MDEQRWWRIKVYEPESRTYTWLDRLGLLDEIEQDLTEEGAVGLC